MIRRIFAAAFAVSFACVLACSGNRTEGMEQSKLPDNLRGDYAVFARKCSKCHSLARPLNATVESDQQWVNYVNRMRRSARQRDLTGRHGSDPPLPPLVFVRGEEPGPPAALGFHRWGCTVKKLRAPLAALAVVFAALFALATPAQAIERNFAGSAQIDYHFVPTAHDAKAFPNSFDGFTTEFSGKLAVDFSERVSANLKVCYGCHGFEADMMYFDFRVADELNFRAGRFSPSFGAFNLRHDPANHRSSDKPLPYDMGRMLRMRQWNQGVLPAPFPDNGLEVDGTKWFGPNVQLDYAVYAVTGFKASANPQDIDFIQSRSPSAYYTDDNARPTVGGRAALTVKFSDTSDMTIGASGMRGTYDPDNKQAYLIFGGDLTLRLDKTTIRAEYLARRTDFDTTDRTLFKYVVADTNGDFFMKHGAYAEVEQTLTPDLDVFARADGMFRVGNVTANSELGRKASVIRGTLGTAYAIERGLRVKFSTELWKFSDKDPANGREVELSMHLALAGSF